MDEKSIDLAVRVDFNEIFNPSPRAIAPRIFINKYPHFFRYNQENFCDFPPTPDSQRTSDLGSGKDADKFDDLARHLQADEIIVDRESIINATPGEGAEFRQILQAIQLRKLDKNEFINPQIVGRFESGQILQERACIANFEIHEI
jgi:hypothetical protein